uniref:Uncharacterized protein n=1 Tax=Panagrolaimus sp. PS1159 TaxID=55785 RepID=A0AC35FNN8_9BILA
MFSISSLLAASAQNNNINSNSNSESKKSSENSVVERIKSEIDNSSISDLIFPKNSNSPTPLTANLFHSQNGGIVGGGDGGNNSSASVFWLNPATAAAMANGSSGGGGISAAELQNAIVAGANQNKAFEQYLMMAKRSRKFFL